MILSLTQQVELDEPEIDNNEASNEPTHPIPTQEDPNRSYQLEMSVVALDTIKVSCHELNLSWSHVPDPPQTGDYRTAF